MKFSTTSTTASFTQPPKPKHYFLAQPHQPFFLFGVLWAIVSMVLFTLSHKGMVVLSIEENVFHLYSLAFIVFTQFFHGFLFTTFPRFCMSDAIEQKHYTPIVWLYEVAALLFFIGAMTSAWVVFIAMIGILLAHLMALITLLLLYREGKTPHKSDPFWILIAHAFGISANAMLVLVYGMGLIGISIHLFSLSPIIVNLFLVFMTFIAAQRMIPFFSHSFEIRPKYFVGKVFTFLVAKTLFSILMIPFAEAVVSILLSLYLFLEFLSWKLPLFRSSAILWILYLALFWLPTALFIGGLTQLIEVFTHTVWLFAGTHLLVLGFVTTVLIGFGTRVTLGHSGQPPHADTLAIILFLWTQVVVLGRFALSADSALGGFNPWTFDAVSFVWIVLFVVWGARYGNILLFGKTRT